MFEQLKSIRSERLKKSVVWTLQGMALNKKKHSNSWLKNQSVLSHGLDKNNYCLMATLDLNAKFHVVNINLLMKRLKILGLPSDLIDDITIWL